MANTPRTGTVGPLLKQLRLERRITLRDLAERVGLDAGNYSRVERGVFAPPARDKLDFILRELEVEQTKREEILDTADVERGELPSDLQQDEVLVHELPVLFRAVREGDREALDQFIEAVRRDGDRGARRMTERALMVEEACALLGAAWRVLREVDIGMPTVGPENMAVIGEGDVRWIVRREVAAIIDTLRARLAEVERERDEAVQRARVAEAERDVWKADALARAAQAVAADG